MRTETVVRQLYTFNELDDDGKEKAREWWRRDGLDYEWHYDVISDIKQIGSMLGIDIDDVYFSGFSSQGDGACFTGHYAYNPGALPAVMREYPSDTELHQVARDLQTIQRAWFYQLTAAVRHQGHGFHEYCTLIDVRTDDDVTGYDRDITPAEDGIAEALRDFMRWSYRRLEREYDWLMSDEQVDESMICNEYEFTEDGEIV